MSGTQDDDEHGKRSLEADRAMLEKYKTKRSNEGKSTDMEHLEQSDDDLLPNEKSSLCKESGTYEGSLSRDITQSSVSISEGDADADLEGLAGRVAELEELLQGKEAIVGVLNAEIDHLRAEASSPNSSQSQSSSHGRDIIALYHGKLQEFERAVNQRDNLLEHLTLSLEQALAARNAVTAQLNSLNSMHVTEPVINNVNLQQKIDVLETTMNDQEVLIRQLNAQLMDIREHVQTLEMEKETRNTEINDYKTQIDNLNEQIRLSATEKNLNIDETLKQQKQYEARVDKIKQDMEHILNKFTSVTNANAVRHQEELKDLSTKNDAEVMNIKAKHEECMKMLKEENKILADRLNKELPNLETRHAKELSIFQTQLAYYKKTVEALKLELVNHTESQKLAQSEVNLYKSKLDELRFETENQRRLQDLQYHNEKDLLNEQINLHKLQLEEITSKQIAAMSILDSKESIERSLEQALANASVLKQENDTLKNKLDDLSFKYSAAQSVIDSSQIHERTLGSRIYDLEKSLSRFDSTNVNSTSSELCETVYGTFDEELIQYQLTQRKLQEKMEMEKLLVDKVRTLEENLFKANNELERANLAKETYEKQLKDMKNTCDKLQQEINTLKEFNHETSRDIFTQKIPKNTMNIDNTESTRRLKDQQKEIESLKLLIEQKETENAACKKDFTEIMKKNKKLEAQCEQLKGGLAHAWAQCADFEERLNQTLAMGDTSKLHVSLNNTSSIKQFEISKSSDDSENAEDQKEISDPNNVSTNILTDIINLRKENENFCKKLHQLLQDDSSLDEVKPKLHRYYALCEKIATEKTTEKQLSVNNVVLQKPEDSEDPLRKAFGDLWMEKEQLGQEIENVINRHKEELKIVKSDSAKEINRLLLLLQNFKDGDANLNSMKTDLEAHHAKEMEELRTYFERKCLQMEKQYSEEIFSQQSKRMSDNDSETEELTDDLYYGGAGDCLNVSNSRDVTPVAIDESLKNKSLDIENRIEIETDYENNIKVLQQELEYKTGEIANIKARYEKKIEELKELYECQIRDIETKFERSTISIMHQYCQTEWEALENGELSSLRAAYNHQLEEQIALARQDIVNALQEQFQTLLSMESDKEDNWPPELLELRDKFTCNAKQEILELKKSHNAELIRIKNEHDCTVAKIFEQHQKKLNTIKINSQDTNQKQEADVISSEDSIIEERNNLRKTCVTLRNLIGELVNYFVICEEEVNNTLISEVLKRQSESVLTTEGNLSKDENMTLSESKNVSNQSIKRVHFAPQCSEITSIVNSDNRTLQTLINEDEDVDEKLRKELKVCLKRLKSDSTEILNLSLPNSQDKIRSSKEDLLANKINEELSLKLNHAETLIIDYQEEMEQLKLHILKLQRKLISAESKKEVITEGYGESNVSTNDIALQDVLLLQEKARHVLSNGGGDTSYLLQLIEELCRQNDKLIDDAKKEKEDLQQQVEAADKQLRATRRFLDEQASEREMERDEAAKQIRSLQEQLKEREREKERDMRISSESELSSETTLDIPELQTTDINVNVEALEFQMREMSSLMSDTEAKKSEKESELKAAVDKIWVLREIITELEQQLQAKIEREESLQMQIAQLEAVITAQSKNQHELVQELDAIKSGSESRHLNEQINHLQEELSKHKLSSEHFNVNSSVLKQMKTELHEMVNQLDKRIRELESAHMCGSNLTLSQRSEDVSFREQIDATRCVTPDDPSAPPMLPLDLIFKLKEKMLKHARAEEVAFKRIKDLEMQLTAVKNQNEELLAEQEILQQTASEQLFQIEAMRGRLEQHKQSAPFAHKQATSRLELQLHEASAKYHSLEQTVTDREMELKELRAQLIRTTQILNEKETEMENLVQSENGAMQKLRDQLKLVEEEKKILQVKLGTQEHTQLDLPQLIDTMLADKNEEIDHLKEQLSRKQKQLDVYLALGLDEMQLRDLIKQTESKNSARTLSDILSIHSECEEFPEAIRAPNTTHASYNVSSLRIPTSTFQKNTLNTSSFDALETPLLGTDKNVQVPLLDLDSLIHSPNQNVHHSGRELHLIQDESKLSSPKDNDVSEDSPRVEELLNNKLKEIENLSSQVRVLQQELELKSNDLKKLETELSSWQERYQSLQDEFKETIENLVQDKNFYRDQYELAQASENKIKKDLEEVENIVKLKTNELEDYKSRMQVNEKIITELDTENTKLKREIEVKEKDQSKKSNSILQDKLQELQKLKDFILEKDMMLNTLQTRNIEIENENKQLFELRTKIHAGEQEIVDLQDEIHRLTDGLNNRDQVIRRLEEIARRTTDNQSMLDDDNTSSPSSSSNKDQEIHHLQEFLKEKDKVIRQMSDDSKSLERALETIAYKMRESGNIVELRRKLKDERKLNAELKDMVQYLQKELENIKIAQHAQEDSDIEDMVQRELNLSARLDNEIMQVIKNDVRNVSGVAEEHQQTLDEIYKGNKVLKKSKNDLEIEREIMKDQITEYEARILQLKADLAQEARNTVELNKQLTSEREIAQFLRIQIDEYRRTTDVERARNTKLIESLQNRLRLSLENEEKLRNDMTSMRQQQINLDMQLTLMRKEMEAENINKNSLGFAGVGPNETKSTNKSIDESRGNNAELLENIKKLETKMIQYENQLEIATEERERLISGLTLSNGLKEILEADYKRTMEELKAREKECNHLQKQLKILTEDKNKKQEQQKDNLEEIKQLRKQIALTRENRIDLETDIKLAKQELKEFSERELKFVHTVESLKEREAELNTKLTLTKERERKLKELIEDLQPSTKATVEREENVRELKSRQTNTRGFPTSFIQKIKELNETIEKYSVEKNNLQEKVNRIREERELLAQRVRLLEGQIKKLKSAQSSSKQTVPQDRTFYGKYLRSESRRKALTYQKKYLLCIVGSYQYCEENTLCVLAQLTQDERSHTRVKPKRNVHFRIAVLAIISICRMKWLIQRWRIGKRVGANALILGIEQWIDVPPIRRKTTNHSPPVRERMTTNGGLDNFTIGQYYQRVKDFQEIFDSVMAESGPSHIDSE